MSKIMITCPNTSREVWTGVETDANTFEHLSNARARMNCSACGEAHEWSRSEAWLAGFEKTFPPRRRESSPGRD